MNRAERLAEIVGRDWATGDLDRRFLLELLREARVMLVVWDGSPWESHLYPLSDRTEALLADLAPLAPLPTADEVRGILAEPPEEQ